MHEKWELTIENRRPWAFRRWFSSVFEPLIPVLDPAARKVRKSRYFGVQFYLEDLLGCAIDLVTEQGLRAELRPFIEAEAVSA